MSDFNALDLVPVIATLRDDVLSGRNSCQTKFVQSLYDTLAVKLQEMSVDLQDEIERERQFAAGKGTEWGNGLYEIYHIRTCFEAKWSEPGAISLLDPIYDVWVFEGEAIDVGFDYTELPASELEELPDLIDTIYRKTGTRFVVARVAKDG